MFKFLSNKLLDWKLKQLPEAQREMVKAIMASNPELLRKIQKETEAKKKAGMPEQAAAMQVFFAHKQEIAAALQKAGVQREIRR